MKRCGVPRHRRILSLPLNVLFFFKLPLCLSLAPSRPPLFLSSFLFTPSRPDSISSVALQCNNISFTNAASCFQFVRASPRLFLRRWKQQRQMDKNYKNVLVNEAALRDSSVLSGAAWEKTHTCMHACYSKSSGCVKKLPRSILFFKTLVRRNPKSRRSQDEDHDYWTTF